MSRVSDYPPIVGICGDIGAGKDTVADALEMRLGFIQEAFADRLKAWVASVFPWVPGCHFIGTQEEKAQTLYVVDGITWTGRKLLEHLGEAARAAYPDVWVKPVMDRIDASDPWHWVISDVRHPNEFQAIWARGGVVWEVVKISDRPAERTGHISDVAWRTMRKDATLTARQGEVDALKDLAVRLAKSGGRDG